MKKITPLFFILFFICFGLQGQNYINFNTSVGFPTDLIYQIDDRDGDSKWMSTIGGGILHWTDADEVIQYNVLNSVLEADSIFSTFRDSQDNFWVATFGSGLVKIDADGWWHYYTPENSLLPSNFVTKVVEDQDGNIYVATLEFMSILADGIENGGIIQISPEGEWTHYSKDNSPLTTNNTFSLLVDPANNLWIGTINAVTPDSLLDNGGGLCMLSETGDWTIYDTENSGIGANNIMSLAMDDTGNLYAGSMDGFLSRLDTEGNWLVNWFEASSDPVVRGSILNMYYHDSDLYIGFGPSDLLCMPIIITDDFDLRGFWVYRDVNNSFFKENIFFPESDSINVWGNLLAMELQQLEPPNMDFYTSFDFIFGNPFNFGYPYVSPYYPFKDFTVSSFHVDEYDNLWIGTVGGGLYVFNEDSLEQIPSYDMIETPLTALAEEGTNIENLTTSSINIYPNPTTERAFITWDNNLLHKNVTIKIVNVEGKMFYQKNQSIVSQTLPLELSNLSNGMYILQVYEGSNLLGSERIEVLR